MAIWRGGILYNIVPVKMVVELVGWCFFVFAGDMFGGRCFLFCWGWSEK